MFLRWLLTTFPQEMRAAWALLRPDLLLWIALSCLVAVAAASMPPPGNEPPPALPLFVSILSGLVTSMLPAVLFTAQSEGRQLTWGPVLLLMARKAAPLVGFALVAVLIAWVAETSMIVAVSFALGDSSALIPLSTIAGKVILVSILVRYNFLPFLVILQERERLPAALWQWKRAAPVAPYFWPLTASARLSEGRRWRLVFYTLMGQALPVLATWVMPQLLLPTAVAAMLVLTLAQGVFFLHYRSSCEDAGAPAPSLPLEAALVA